MPLVKSLPSFICICITLYVMYMKSICSMCNTHNQCLQQITESQFMAEQKVIDRFPTFSRLTSTHIHSPISQMRGVQKLPAVQDSKGAQICMPSWFANRYARASSLAQQSTPLLSLCSLTIFQFFCGEIVEIWVGLMSIFCKCPQNAYLQLIEGHLHNLGRFFDINTNSYNLATFGHPTWIRCTRFTMVAHPH